MGLLDFEDPKPLYTPPKKTGAFNRESAETQQNRDGELNNFGRKEVTEDFADSPFADRKD
jgi:hypothetical protein